MKSFSEVVLQILDIFERSILIGTVDLNTIVSEVLNYNFTFIVSTISDMNLLGIDFVPLNVPLKTRIQALCAGGLLFLTLGLLPIGSCIIIYMLLFSKYWSYFCIYLLWIWVIDRNISEKGGRPNEWVRSWKMFTYAFEYFPVRMHGEPGFQLDPRRNYISCTFPHGAMPMGSLASFFPNANKASRILYPHHFLHGVTLKSNFLIPIYREFLLAMGLCSTSPRSINWLLSRPEGGRIVGIVIGGAAESFYCNPGHYHLVLKNRKGFIKLALKNGAPLVPTFVFGQNDSFKQVVFSEESTSRRLQNLIKRITGIAPIVFYGRGLFQYNFGMIPLQKPINIVLGNPIDVQKTEQPTAEDIDALHKLFIERISEIFEKYKHEYEENPEQSSFTIS